MGTSEGNRLVSGAGESLGSPTQAMANLQPMGGPPVAGLRSHGTFRLRIRQANRANSQPESVIRSLPMGRRLPHSMNMPSGACSTVTECTQPSDPSTNGAIAPEDAAGRVAPGGRRTCASDVRIVLPPKKKGRHAEAAGTANAPDQAQGRGSILLKLPLRARGDGAEPSGRPAASKRPSRKRRQIAPAKPKAKRQRMPAKGEASRAAPCKAPRLDAVSAEEGGSEISPQGGKQEKKTRQPRGKAVKSRAASAKEARNPEVSSLEVRGRENVAKRGRVARLPPKKALEKPSRSKATSSTRLRLALRASSKMDGSGDAAEKASGSKAPVENKEPVEASAPPAAPCFAKEVENLSTREACDASARGMGGLQTTVTCGVCHEDTVNGLKHPFFPLVGLDICRGCENSLLFDRGPGRKDSSPSSAQRIIHRTTLMVVLIEDIIQTMTPSERSRRGVDMVYKCVSSRSQDDMVERAESLPVPYEMLTVLRVALRKIGLTIRAGRVVWPTSTIQLPSAEDSHALVLSSIPRSFADLRSNNTGAERVWKAVFGEELQGVKSSYDIYQKLLGLLGIKLSHLDNSETCENRSQGCKVQLDKVSIDAAMYRTAAMVSGTVMRAVLGECWGEQEVLRYMEANDTRLAFEQSLSGNHGEVCSICVTPYDESGFPFRYVECTDCKRKFCSVCLSNVCGASEYARGIGEEAYCCMLCRVRRHGKEQWIDNEVHGGRKRHGPFLRLSSEMKKTVTGGSKGDEVKRIEDIRFAKFCEVSNEECVAGKLRANGRNVSFERIGDELCIGCKQTAITGGQDIHLEDSIGVLCNAEKCTNVMHKKCCEVPKEQQTRRRGSRTRWTCPQHQCGKCDQRDEGKILRCRTCPRAYCRDHLPSPCEIHLFSDRYMACPDCAPKVMGPTESAGGRMTEAARRRNYMTGGSMVGVGQRKCCVKRLEEVDVECCNISFEQFQREMEDKMER